MVLPYVEAAPELDAMLELVDEAELLDSDTGPATRTAAFVTPS